MNVTGECRVNKSRSPAARTVIATAYFGVRKFVRTRAVSPLKSNAFVFSRARRKRSEKVENA